MTIPGQRTLEHIQYYRSRDRTMIRVGLTELHGISREVSANPGNGVEYVEVENVPAWTDRIIGSQAKGVLRRFENTGCDLLEAPLFPILTDEPWIYTPARFSGATAFNLAGLPIPRRMRVSFIESLMLRPNFLKLVFKSKAGAETLRSYGNVTDPRILEKVDVVYPCMRRVPDHHLRQNENEVRFLFSGDFFRKGGASVVDAFARLATEYSDVYLRICSSPDLNIGDNATKDRYLKRIANLPRTRFGPVTRDEMLNTVLPESDVFVSPTLQEAFGFALVEASAYALPVISTQHFAIPEIVEDGKSGILIDLDGVDSRSMFNGARVRILPPKLHDYLTESVYDAMRKMVEDVAMASAMGEAGLRIARSRFSFEERNRRMYAIYSDELATYRGRSH